MDMLVKLYALKESDLQARLTTVGECGVAVRRAMAHEKHTAMSFVHDHFTGGFSGWPSECDVAFGRSPVSCLIAVHQRRIVGFACYNSTWKGFFGPIGVLEGFQGKGIGAALLLAALFAMKAEGYAYAVIGGANKQPGFYEHVVGAVPIPGSDPGAYPEMLADLVA